MTTVSSTNSSASEDSNANRSSSSSDVGDREGGRLKRSSATRKVCKAARLSDSEGGETIRARAKMTLVKGSDGNVPLADRYTGCPRVSNWHGSVCGVSS